MGKKNDTNTSANIKRKYIPAVELVAKLLMGSRISSQVKCETANAKVNKNYYLKR